MSQILLRAGSFALIIVVGICLNHFGIVGKDTGAGIKKILINITLPCAIITNFAAVEDMSAAMLLVAVFGIVANILMIAVAAVVSGRLPKREQALNILCMPGYNIGAFCLPFVQSFLPAIGTVTACMMDLGNSVMCSGVTYAFAAEYVSEEHHGFDMASFGKRLIKSAPLLANVGMFLISLAGLRLPDAVLTLIEPAAKANSFVAMLMLGLLFRLELKPEYIRKVGKVLAFHYVFAAVLAVVVYVFLPLELAVRQALVLLCFAPSSAVAPAYTGMCGGDEGMASCINSLSIVCSLVAITGLIGILGIYV
ncbi:MAG: hypothetical protein LIO81_08040 [Clostridiales bacterium]|nr:hypothetical protein [Clostridiales bacterium]